jgi:hypothetical protein
MSGWVLSALPANRCRFSAVPEKKQAYNDLFPEATVWIQKEEFRYYTGEEATGSRLAIVIALSAFFRHRFHM